MNDSVYYHSQLSEQAQAGRIHRQEVPRHIGGDQGQMQGEIDRGSEEVSQSGSRNNGNLGVGVYGESELPGTNDINGQGEFGSATVVTIGEMGSIEPELDPTTPKPKRTPAQIMAEVKARRLQG